MSIQRARFGSFLEAASFIYHAGLYGVRLHKLPTSGRWVVVWRGNEY